jgi:hypothetical protein
MGEERVRIRVAQIPSSAINVAVGAMQRRSVEAARARAVQGKKDIHHAEEVAELEEGMVGAVGEEDPGGGQPQQQGEKKKRLDVKAAGVPEDEPPHTAALDIEA